MAWGKSKSGSDGLPPDNAAPPTDSAPSEDLPQPGNSPQRDNVLVALVAQTEQLNERLTKLEDRFDAAMSTNDEVDTDLHDLRVNSARLAAALQRVTAELRSDIEAIPTAGAEPRTEQVAEPDIDLTTTDIDQDSADQTLRLRRSHNSSGWLPLDD